MTPTLDPQLVWKGKDELDGEDLVADAPAIYIQEKIDPRVLVENLRRTAVRPQDEPELTLFEGFDGLGELDLVDFYRHQANWSNRMILGDSLNVMASLAEREALRGKVQMIYLDPPYGIKFGSNWQVSARKRDVKDGKLEDASREVERSRRSATRGSSASTPTCRTSGTASSLRRSSAGRRGGRTPMSRAPTPGLHEARSLGAQHPCKQRASR